MAAAPWLEWQAYQINSATLTVGADVDSSPIDESRYEQASRAHVMTTSYDGTDVSWNNSDQSTTTAWGGGTIDTTGGTDWESAVQATGVVGTGITTFDLTSYVVGVMDGTYSGAGEGLFFETTDATLGQLSRTQAANVSGPSTPKSSPFPNPPPQRSSALEDSPLCFAASAANLQLFIQPVGLLPSGFFLSREHS